MVEYINEILNFTGIAVSVIVPVVLIRFFHVSDTKRVEKDRKLADDLKGNTERIANDLKTNEERIAKDLKLASVDIAQELQSHLDTQNSNVMKNIETISQNMISLGERVDKISIKVDQLSIQQAETQKDQLALIHDLQTRADMTNGSIQHIRNDIMDVQDVTDNILDRMAPQTQESVDQNAKDVRSKQRRNKRNQINDDALSQGMDKINIGKRR